MLKQRMAMTVALAGGIFSLVLVSCTVGPDYKAPKTTVPNGFANAAPVVPTTQAATRPSNATTQAAPVAQWWMTLHDPELDKLIDRAVAGNIGLQEAGSRVCESRAALRLAGAKELPTLDATGAFAKVDSGQNVSLGGNGSGSSGIATSIWQVGFDATWEIDVFGGQRRRIEAAAADFQSSVEERREAMVSLTAEVARDYLQLRGVQQRIQIARDNLALQEDTLGLTRSLRKAGFKSELDVSRAQTQVSQTRAQIVPLTTQRSQQEHAIATLLGDEPNSLAGELDSTVPSQPLPALVAVGMPADLLRRRPDIRRAEQQIVASNARIGAAVADYYPKFSLTGDFGLDSNQFQHLFAWESRYFLIYPSIDWRIFDFGRTTAEVDQEKERHRQMLLAYQDAVLTALREVEDALVAYGNEQEHRAALASAVDSARVSVEIARDQYKQGVIDFLPVLDAQRQLLFAEDELALSDQAMSTNLVALYKALGGGWEVEPAHQPKAASVADAGKLSG